MIDGLKTMVHRVADLAFARRGLHLRPMGTLPRGYSRFLDFAKSCGIEPRTVYDIGVGDGTPWLYEAFPEAHFVLVEALPIFRDFVETTARRLGGEAHIVALSNQPGRLEIRIPSTEATGASLHERSDHMASLRAARGRSNHDEKMIVDVTTLDALATHEGPYFLKIDVEGAELDVLAGATRALASTAMVLAELSVFPRHNGEASFAQAVSFLDRAGFELFEIVELHQDGENGPLVFLDAAFVRKDFDIWSRVSQTPASRSP